MADVAPAAETRDRPLRERYDAFLVVSAVSMSSEKQAKSLREIGFRATLYLWNPVPFAARHPACSTPAERLPGSP
jgi:hypothetical protein